MARFWPRSLRWRLTLSIATVLIAAFLLTFVLVYREAGGRLRGEIDQQLVTEGRSFSTAITGASPRSAAALGRRARHYLNSQRFSAASNLLFAEIAGSPPATNSPELFGLPDDEHESPAAERAEQRNGRALLAARPGLSTHLAPDVGWIRVYVLSFKDTAGALERVGVAESLEPVSEALEGITRGFAIGGGLTLLGALLAGSLVAAAFSQPLRRMALIAARVDAGDLSPRIEHRGAGGETRVLADAFDHMLDRLEDAFARQQAFVSDASHELRTPLTAIRGQLEVLARQRSPDVEEVQRVQRLVVAEVDRMTRLTEDLLLLAATEESRFLERQPIELEGYLGDLIESLRTTSERRFTLELERPGILNADPDRLAQALRNLLRNAIEHTHSGASIAVSVVAVEPARVRISVDDDGPGIAASERDRVFDRFHRADRGRARISGGTGLGLAIVRAIVDAHGGRVWAAASPLGGARVTIELPGFRIEARTPLLH